MEGMDPKAQIDKSTPYTAIDVAKEFLLRAQNKDPDMDPRMTNMKLNKLVYFAQLVSIRALNRTIHRNNTHAWDYGPVAPLLYKRIKRFGSQSITLENPEMDAAFADAEKIEDQDFVRVVNSVWRSLKGMSPVELSKMTHRPNTPWSVVYGDPQTRYGIITPEQMREYGYGTAE